jgi:hypothetical protein
MKKNIVHPLAAFLLAFAAFFVFALFPTVSAEAANVKGTATINIKGSLLSSVTDAERIAARKAALQDAWKQYLADPDVASQTRTLQKFSSEIENNLEQFMTKIVYLEETVNKDKKQYTVVLAAQIMVDKVQQYVTSRTAAGKQESGSGNGFAILFLMKRGKSSTQFDETRVEEAEKSVTAKTEGDEDGSVSSSTKKRTSSGGSTTQKADEEKFVFEGADQAVAMVGKELAPSGFETTNFKDITDACDQTSLYEEVMDKYQREGESPPIAKLAKFVRECGKKNGISFKYFAVVMAEVGAPFREKGEQRIVASVRMNVQNIEKGLPQAVATTEFQNTGNGKTTAQAQGVVMKKTGTQVGREIVDALNAKGLK